MYKKTYNEKVQQFSVIIPIFNTPVSYLEKCLTAIEQQIYQEFECILINDCSTNKQTIDFINA
jgi:glycosyltransferase involved in cell wall biosynthesis